MNKKNIYSDESCVPEEAEPQNLQFMIMDAPDGEGLCLY